MTDVSKLTLQEKRFLAGSIKSMIMADGTFGDKELESLNLIEKNLKFDDFEKCLEDFENLIKDLDSYWELAEKITNEETRELVLKVLYDLSLQDGFMNKAENNLLTELQNVWGE